MAEHFPKRFTVTQVQEQFLGKMGTSGACKLSKLTFGFMDAQRDPRSNSELFVQLRALASESFKREKVCDLKSFSDDSIDTSHEVLTKEEGSTMGGLRDDYYAQIPQGGQIRLPDVQSYFLYSFTLGVNLFAPTLANPAHLVDPHLLPPNDILERRFPIRGPEWLCNAANAEMPSVENVFCDFQNKMLIPLAKAPSVNSRFLADTIAGAFLWAYFGGIYWLKEAVEEITKSVSMWRVLEPAKTAVYPVKKSMQLIDSDGITRVLTASAIFKEPTKGTLNHRGCVEESESSAADPLQDRREARGKT